MSTEGIDMSVNDSQAFVVQVYFQNELYIPQSFIIRFSP